ncbi:DUF2125 domain-containing protein [Jiella sp. MQZ9-1]|uniref:DUF2125 domain-containing protein n=1 Tax=Jiella flava TaxID=2816857 RepID=A0A939FYI2_9HYPH|nr:DUF2125 domain-containing protein [Jiella flava]MBO0663076.1 DUF2125 domain-containing protein [Jiella flava]MCD2471495.1 DUF2125 domain-containing protein [Jiella flava]
MAASSDSPSKARRALIGVAVIVVLLIAALCGAWFYLAGRLDRELARVVETARERGIDVECPNRDVFGFPFRLGFRCDAISVDRPDAAVRASAGAIRTAAQIYRPNRLVGELDGPLKLEIPAAPPLDMRWSLAQGSATFWTTGLDRVSLIFDNPQIALLEPANDIAPLSNAAHAEAHARRRDGNLDIFTLLRGGRLLWPGAPTLPPLDTSADLTIDGAGTWLSGAARGLTGRELFANRPVSLRSLMIKMGSADADLSGDFSFDDEGRLNGKFKLAIQNPKEIAKLIGIVAPKLRDIAAAVASAVPMAGQQVDGRTVIELRARNGILAVGIFPMGKIPSLR